MQLIGCERDIIEKSIKWVEYKILILYYGIGDLKSKTPKPFPLIFSFSSKKDKKILNSRLGSSILASMVGRSIFFLQKKVLNPQKGVSLKKTIHTHPLSTLLGK